MNNKEQVLENLRLMDSTAQALEFFDPSDRNTLIELLKKTVRETIELVESSK